MIKEINEFIVEWDADKNEINIEDILFVVHTMRNENVRIISARLATKQERRFYYDSQRSDI